MGLINVRSIVGYGAVVIFFAKEPEPAAPYPEQYARQHRPQAVDPPPDAVLVDEAARAHEGICAMISGAEGERQYKYAKAAAGSKVLDVLLIPLPCVESKGQECKYIYYEDYHTGIHIYLPPKFRALARFDIGIVLGAVPCFEANGCHQKVNYHY